MDLQIHINIIPMSKEEMLLKFGVLEKESGEMHCYPDDVYVAMDEYAKQQSIAFHAWMKKCQWSPLVSTIPGPDIYAPEDSDQRLTIEQLYTLFLQQQIK